MNLEQIAQQAMDYLDSVGVAAEYEIGKNDGYLKVFTEKGHFTMDGLGSNVGALILFKLIKESYPQKSPN